GGAGQRVTPAGAVRGLRRLAEIVDDGERAGAAAAEAAIGAETAARHRDTVATVPALDPPDDGLATYPEPAALLFSVHDRSTDPRSLDASFVDLQRDVTVADLARATGAGLLSVELVKRYTTAGTAHDQGKTSGVLASGVVATLLGVDVGDLGTSSYRPPYTPVGFAALAGRERGALYDPVRTTGAHPWHVAHGALFENVGQWTRPWYHPHPGETIDAAVARECAAARTGVAFMDASTLGKIDVQGPDAGEFLDLLYTNLMSSLKVGAIRYGVMCGVDGMILDDGTVFRLADQHFLVTTTTGNAATILDWMEEWRQTEWPHLQVWCTSVTEQWATMALVGPRSRELLSVLAPELDVENDAFGFMTWRSTIVGGLVARVARVSFSGELAYEINVAWTDAAALWDAVWAVGGPIGLTPYGTETMHVLRAEKGYPIIGQDTDGTVTPQDLGMGWVISKKKPDYLGKRSHARAENHRADRKHLVGLLPDDLRLRLPEGCQLVENAELPPPPVPMLGHVTSSYDSVELGRTFALALLKGGRDRIGETVYVVVGGVPQPVTVTSSVLVDPDGTRRDGIELPPLELAAVTPDAGLPVSPLAGFADRFAALSHRPTTGVRIAEAALTTMINVRVRPGTVTGDAVGAVLGVTLPLTTGGRAEAGTDTVLALGPDEYLVTSGPGHGPELAARLAAVEGVGAVVDVSASRTMLRISGPSARRVLAHGCAVDLDRLTCAQTLLAQCAVIIFSDGTPGSDDDLVKVLVRSTFAAHLAEWLLLTAVEYAG
ncbi:MAG: glycine cleavage T C-terminal barrel domain-containing protein, partial [Nakamurella sp.]